jgi:nitroreductase
MKKTDYYHIIFKRKSVRNYDLTPFDDDTIAKISEHLDNIEPMYYDIKTEVKIISSDEVESQKMKKSRHYIAVFSDTSGDYLTNVGFMLQQTDLYLSANGIGCCWQGSPQPKEEVLKSSDLEFIILLAFGKPNEPLHRKVSEFRRKSLQEITDIDGADDLLEAARLAPSAGNSQPWFFKGNKSLIHAYTSKAYPVKKYPAATVKKYNTISMGAAIYHLKVALKHFGKNMDILFDKTAKENVPDGYEYTVSLKIE